MVHLHERQRKRSRGSFVFVFSRHRAIVPVAYPEKRRVVSGTETDDLSFSRDASIRSRSVVGNFKIRNLSELSHQTDPGITALSEHSEQFPQNKRKKYLIVIVRDPHQLPVLFDYMKTLGYKVTTSFRSRYQLPVLYD